MKEIKIGFSTSNALLSRFIRFVTRSSISHSYIRLPMITPGLDLIFQASGLLVNICGSKIFEGHAKIKEEMTFYVTDERFENLELFMYSSLGKKYSLGQLIGMGWVLFCRSLHLNVKNPWRDNQHSYICVELVATALGIPGSEEMTPQDLFDLLHNSQVVL